jgi:hypothetical protein
MFLLLLLPFFFFFFFSRRLQLHGVSSYIKPLTGRGY